jgi:L-asparagine transporter-like permease
VVRGLGNGHVTGIIAWLILAANAIVTGMVAVSFGSYASAALTDGSTVWIKVFAVLLVLAMTLLNIVGSQAVARTQTVIVYVVLTILTLFAVTTLANLDLGLLSFSGYPPLRDIVSSVALTFFAFLGFGVVTFTAKDLTNPSRQLPRAIYLALGIATTIYVAVALGVFGTLTVDKVIESGGTALAVAAEPTLGRAGYWLMSVTALFSTAGATNAGLYPAAGLLITAAAAIVLAAGFDLSSIASLGSAIALLVFTLITAAHFRVRAETGASTLVLSIAITSTVVVLLTFAFTTLVDEPAAAVALVVILLLSVALDVGWKRARDRRIWSLYQRGRLVLVGLPADNEMPRCSSCVADDHPVSWTRTGPGPVGSWRGSPAGGPGPPPGCRRPWPPADHHTHHRHPPQPAGKRSGCSRLHTSNTAAGSRCAL